MALAVATALLAIAAFWSGFITQSGFRRQLTADRRPFVFPWPESRRCEGPPDQERWPRTGFQHHRRRSLERDRWRRCGDRAHSPGGGRRNDRGPRRGGGQTKPQQRSSFLRYTDSAGTEWQTHFAFAGTIGLLASPQLRVDLVGAGATADLGEPQYNAEAWVNAPPAGALRWGATTRRSSDVGAWLGRGIEGIGRRIQNRWGSRPKL